MVFLRFCELVIFYVWPFLRAFWGLFFIFSRVLKQIQAGGLEGLE